MPIYDTRCNECEYEYTVNRKWDADPAACPLCGGTGKTIWKSAPILDRAKDPYDYLNGRIPAPKKIKSFAKDKRKGGKNTV